MTEVQAANSGYTTVAASQTTQNLGTATTPGSWLEGLLVVPATTSAGAVAIKDGSNTAITVFTGGASSVADLKSFWLPVRAYSVKGAWQVTTGAAVSVLAFGTFK